MSTQLLWDEGSTEHRTGRQLRPRHTQGPLLAKGQARSEQLKRGRAARPERPRPAVGGQPRAVGAWAPGALTAAGEGAPRLAHSTPSPQLSTAALSPRPECPSTGHGASAARRPTTRTCSRPLTAKKRSAHTGPPESAAQGSAARRGRGTAHGRAALGCWGRPSATAETGTAPSAENRRTPRGEKPASVGFPLFRPIRVSGPQQTRREGAEPHLRPVHSPDRPPHHPRRTHRPRSTSPSAPGCAPPGPGRTHSDTCPPLPRPPEPLAALRAPVRRLLVPGPRSGDRPPPRAPSTVSHTRANAARRLLGPASA